MSARADTRLAGAAAAAMGAAGMLIFAGAMTSQLPIAVAAAVLGGVAALGVLAAGWVESLWPVAVAMPLPALYSSQEARLSPILLVSAVVVGAWLVRVAVERRPLGPASRDARMLGLVWGAVVVAAVFAQDHLVAAREVVNFGLLLGLFAVTRDLVTERRQRAEVLARWIAIAAAAAGAAAVAEAFGFLPTHFTLAGTGFFRASGGFAWPNELAMFLAISLPLTIHQLRRARRASERVGAATLIALTALGLGATFSRGSWLSVTLAPAILLFVGEGRVAVRFWGVALAGAVAVDLATGGAVVDRIAATGSDVLVAQRLLLTLAGLVMFRAHPLLGVGPGGFGANVKELGVQVSGIFVSVASAQNGYVQIAAESGVVGLVALLLFVGATLRSLTRGARAARSGSAAHRDEGPLRSALLWSFTTACVVSLFEWPFTHGVGELIVMVAATGMALAGTEERP